MHARRVRCKLRAAAPQGGGVPADAAPSCSSAFLRALLLAARRRVLVLAARALTRRVCLRVPLAGPDGDRCGCDSACGEHHRGCEERYVLLHAEPLVSLPPRAAVISDLAAASKRSRPAPPGRRCSRIEPPSRTSRSRSGGIGSVVQRNPSISLLR